MMSEEYIVCGWDSEVGAFRRPMTDEEIAQVHADRAAAAAPVVPKSIPMLNARLALIGAGWMAGVKAHLDAMTGVEGEQARAYLEYAQNVRRDHWMVEGFRQALDKTQAEVDALFITGAAID